jgi:hypothetical protein
MEPTLDAATGTPVATAVSMIARHVSYVINQHGAMFRLADSDTAARARADHGTPGRPYTGSVMTMNQFVSCFSSSCDSLFNCRFPDALLFISDSTDARMPVVVADSASIDVVAAECKGDEIILRSISDALNAASVSGPISIQWLVNPTAELSIRRVSYPETAESPPARSGHSPGTFGCTHRPSSA